jgi:hypothetical protein
LTYFKAYKREEIEKQACLNHHGRSLPTNPNSSKTIDVVPNILDYSAVARMQRKKTGYLEYQIFIFSTRNLNDVS